MLPTISSFLNRPTFRKPPTETLFQIQDDNLPLQSPRRINPALFVLKQGTRTHRCFRSEWPRFTHVASHASVRGSGASDSAFRSQLSAFRKSLFRYESTPSSLYMSGSCGHSFWASFRNCSARFRLFVFWYSIPMQRHGR